ncbi:MAG: hypothetical protein KAS85_07880, partial [Rhodobacteraceae bacterium]|nr:hypothetical protein [Paracoccaceae bacterium]
MGEGLQILGDTDERGLGVGAYFLEGKNGVSDPFGHQDRLHEPPATGGSDDSGIPSVSAGFANFFC